jgi:hypothetical protein
MNSAAGMTTNEKFIVMRTLRKKQFCRVEMKPNIGYKPEAKDNRKPVLDVTRVGILKKSLNCKGKMIDGTDTCKFPERFLRSVSDLPPKTPPATNAYKVSADMFGLCLKLFCNKLFIV